MSARDIDDAFKNFPRIKNARRIVRVDDDDAFRFRRYLALDIREIGVPVALLVADIMNGSAARKADGSRPERIIGSGQKDLVPRIEQRLQRKRYHFTASVARVYVADIDVRDLFQLTVLHYRLTGGKNAF